MEWYHYFVFGFVYLYLLVFMVWWMYIKASFKSWDVILKRAHKEAGKELHETWDDEYQYQLWQVWYTENKRSRGTVAYAAYDLWADAIHEIRRS